MSEDATDSSGSRDAAVMEAILKEMGVEDHEPNVIQQMLEFSYRYVTNVLEDARVYSEHAQKKELDVSDVKLAVQTRVDHSFTAPPPRDFLIEVARKKNSTPLPLIPEKFGPRLPPERYCLTANNYKLKDKQKTPSLQKPQVTLAATFRLPLSTKQQSTTSNATSALRTQLTSPLQQFTSASAMSSSSMSSVSGGTSGESGLTRHIGSGLQSPAVSGHSMPTLTPMGSEQTLGQLSGNTNTNNSRGNSRLTSLIMSMPRINKLD